MEPQQDIKQQVATLLRQARKTRGLTQKELGEKLGIDEKRLNRLESGRTNFTIDTLQKILSELNFSIDLILKG